jgi:uncharacterized membrane protein
MKIKKRYEKFCFIHFNQSFAADRESFIKIISSHADTVIAWRQSLVDIGKRLFVNTETQRCDKQLYIGFVSLYLRVYLKWKLREKRLRSFSTPQL